MCIDRQRLYIVQVRHRHQLQGNPNSIYFRPPLQITFVDKWQNGYRRFAKAKKQEKASHQNKWGIVFHATFLPSPSHSDNTKK